MDWIARVQNVDRRIIYLLLAIFCVVPLINPIGIPLLITERTDQIYQIIEGLDPATDKVLLVFDYSPGTGLDAHVVPVAIVQHLASRGIPWVAVSFTPDGPMMCDRLVDGINLEGRGFEYGVDFVNLGYIAGLETAVRFFAQNCLYVEVDTRGNTVADLPIMQGVATVVDFAFVMQFNAGGPETWVRQDHVSSSGVNSIPRSSFEASHSAATAARLVDSSVSWSSSR
jgi:hypothetical protein